MSLSFSDYVINSTPHHHLVFTAHVMICADTASRDFEAESAVVMSASLAVSGGASTAVEGLHLARSVLERTCEEFLSRCVGRLGMNTVKASRERKRGPTTPRITRWNCSCSLDEARRYSVGCARRKYVWSHCRATSLLTSSSCLWRTDPETKRMTAECELLPLVGCGKFDCSAFEGMALVSGATDLSPGNGEYAGFLRSEGSRLRKEH